MTSFHGDALPATVNDNLRAKIRRLLEHARWADERLLDALRREAPPAALREQAHVIGASEVWLSRLEGRRSRCDVWPSIDLSELEQLTAEMYAGLTSYVDGLRPADLDADVSYVNSAGKTFTTSVGDILLHVFLHAQYHRGKVNLILRQEGSEPAAVDLIAYVRGAPAATERDAGKASEI